MYILGISSYYHDSACALVRDGKIVSAAQEERFTRKKHDARFPHYALQYCLQQAKIKLNEVDYIVFYDKPFLKFERLLETYIAFAPRGFSSFRIAMPAWLKEKLFLKKILCSELGLHYKFSGMEERLLFAEHHESHAASAFFPSPFDNAAILTMDGVGEWATTSVGVGVANKLTIRKEINFPHSLGLLYSAFTYYTGFKVNSGEYKLMGLAPYGKPVYANKILENLIDLKQDGSFRLNMDYFDYCTGLKMTNEKFNEFFGGPPRKEGEQLSQHHMNLASSIQAVTEEVVLKLTDALAIETGSQNLCLAGGVALNCVANGKVVRNGKFKNIWIQPASGDAGGAVGAALAGYYLFSGQQRFEDKSGLDGMSGAYLGPEFAQSEIEDRLFRVGAVFEVLDDNSLFDKCVNSICSEQALGWFQGRMEFGPRALGARSILGDPRSPSMQSLLNLKVKYRESFRPFAPSVLREDLSDWFELATDSPYMLLVADVVKSKRRLMTAEEEQLFGIDKLNVVRSEIPAVTHIDYSSRVQTVHKETNPKYHALLSAFKEKTGCSVLVNTSFNVRGEPIVCTPEDAFNCFMGTEIESLAIGNCFLSKACQKQSLRRNYESAFELD